MSTNKSILIIEDELSLLEILEDAFRQEGFVVYTATDGEEGLKRAMHQKPDVIILDILLPKLDGMSLLKKLRIDSWGKNVPVIILTNLSDDEKEAEAANHNVESYLVKSDLSLNDIVQHVKETFDKFSD